MSEQVCCERFAEFRQISELITSSNDYHDSRLNIEYNKGSNCLEIQTEAKNDMFYFEFCPFCGKAIEG
jgi:hypothetical protein